MATNNIKTKISYLIEDGRISTMNILQAWLNSFIKIAFSVNVHDCMFSNTVSRQQHGSSGPNRPNGELGYSRIALDKNTNPAGPLDQQESDNPWKLRVFMMPALSSLAALSCHDANFLIIGVVSSCWGPSQ